MKELIDLIINNLDDKLLKPKYRKVENRNKYSGHCYVATETLYHLINNDENEYFPATLKIGDITHWFLKNRINGDIIDITKKRFNYDLDYTKSRFRAFLTKNPSKRCKILINKIL